jgi:hypothetical protein
MIRSSPASPASPASPGPAISSQTPASPAPASTESTAAVFQINIYSPSTGLNPRVATNGTQFLVAYWEDRYQAFTQLRAVRVSHEGQVLDPGGIEITEAYGYTNFEPAVTWDGAYYFVVFDHDAFDPDIFAARVTPEGTVLDFNGVPVTADANLQSSAAVAPRSGGGVVAIWKDRRTVAPMRATSTAPRSPGRRRSVRTRLSRSEFRGKWNRT